MTGEKADFFREYSITVSRQARYFTLGEPGPQVRQVWFLCHGYGQLAASFLRSFIFLDDGARLFVAPEALSRFYIDTPHRTVGASWMTREDRLAEIQDYVTYLDAVQARVFQVVKRENVDIYVLGFSQGAATASRWVSSGAISAQRLIVWGETVPPELDSPDLLRNLRAVRLTLVRGRRDGLLTEEAWAEQRDRLRRHGVRFEELEFDGGHRLDDAVLARLAAAG